MQQLRDGGGVGGEGRGGGCRQLKPYEINDFVSFLRFHKRLLFE